MNEEKKGQTQDVPAQPLEGIIILRFFATLGRALVALMLSGCIIPIPIRAINKTISGGYFVSRFPNVGNTFIESRSGETYLITEINKTDDGTPYQDCGARLPNRAKADLVSR